MDAKRIADKYIGPRGGKPRPERAERPAPPKGEGVTISIDEYKRLLLATECDDMIVICEGCGAWIDRDEPAFCTADEVAGCWKYLTGSGLCVSHRSPKRDAR